jgi:hypothetical protein
MDLIISGDRTRTTRANTDIQRMSKDYNLSKISDLVGKVIRMTDKTGRQVYTRITKVTPFTQEYQDATWQKEGWVKSVTDKNVGQYPYAIEFEVVKKPTQPSTSVEESFFKNFIDRFKENHPELYGKKDIPVTLNYYKDYNLSRQNIVQEEVAQETLTLDTTTPKQLDTTFEGENQLFLDESFAKLREINNNLSKNC